LEKERQILTEGLRELGIDPLAGLLDQFDVYLRELKKWNRVYNLTAITDDRDVVVKHFLDSLLYLKVLPQGHFTLCDVGTGGGFPGIPIAIIRQDITVTLLEPSRKKIAFVRQMRRLLALKNVEIINLRAEEMEGRQFDMVVTRATFPVAGLMKKAGHLLKPGGLFVLSKGPRYEDELKDLPAGIKAEVIVASIPKTGLSRNLLIIPA
jgi:16S rRNA (guanine527-N7)-methyltransferase